MHLATASILIATFLYFSYGSAGEHLDHGPTGTQNHDYFSASQDVQLNNLLSLVEKFHFYGCPHNPKGVLGDVAAGKLHLAIHDLTYTLERFVNHPKALQLMGAVAKLAHTPALGISFFERALTLYPQYALTHFQYGSYLVEIGRFDAVVAVLQKALEINPNLALAYAWLAHAYAKKGDLAFARQAGKRAQELGYREKLPGVVQENRAK